MTNEQSIETCCVCSGTTGRAGRGEDSLFCATCEEALDVEVGPFCEECFNDHKADDGDDNV